MNRRMEEELPTAFPSPSPSSSPAPSESTTNLVTLNDGEKIISTLVLFGSFFLISFLIYGFIRTRYPRAYNIRSWAPKVKTDLAENLYGYFEWMWALAWISDDEMREECGLDALCFCRVFLMGFKIALLGMLHSCWLMPVYATAEKTSDNEHVTDWVTRLSIANVPAQSVRLYAAVAAAYFTFWFTMRLMLAEFKWFTEQRHAWLMERKPRNYTVYCTGIPKEYRSSAELMKYFRNCFNHFEVFEARIALVIPNLERLVARRAKLVARLEHAINVEDVRGKTPMMIDKNNLLEGPRSAITVYAERLDALNDEIAGRKATLLAANDPSEIPDTEGDEYSLVRPKTRRREDASAGGASAIDSVEISSISEVDTADPSTGMPQSSEIMEPVGEAVGAAAGAIRAVTIPTNPAGEMATNIATAAINLIVGIQDGERRESGFVTFSKLSTRQAALQMVHHPSPFVMDVAEAPDPEDIFWPNCGRAHEDKQAGMLTSIASTAILLILWTFPTAFVVSLTNVENLAREFPFLENAIIESPFLGNILAVMAPLLLIPFNVVLKFFLRIFTKYEGPVSQAVLEASLFIKLAVFKVVQTFFVSTIAGSFNSEISNATDADTFVTVLASTLPSQAIYFVQILLVQTSLELSFELLRVRPLLGAWLRKFFQPKLSKKERDKSIFFGILRPLSDPRSFEHADLLSQSVLYFMVLLTYGALSPLVNWFLGFTFLLLVTGYRNQFVYCYPVTDSGGKMYKTFTHFVPLSMLIAELALGAYLGLKEAPIPASLMFVLIIITFLFYIYIGQRHYKVFEHLPSRECVRIDKENRRDGRADLVFLKDQYLQPALRARDYERAENMGVTQEIRYTGVQYVTPPGSEAEVEPLESIEEEEDLDASKSDGGERETIRFEAVPNDPIFKSAKDEQTDKD